MKVVIKTSNIDFQNDEPWTAEKIHLQNLRCLKIVVKKLKSFSFIQSSSFLKYGKGLNEKYDPLLEKN
jgi:hypothetical protein